MSEASNKVFTTRRPVARLRSATPLEIRPPAADDTSAECQVQDLYLVDQLCCVLRVQFQQSDGLQERLSTSLPSNTVHKEALGEHISDL